MLDIKEFLVLVIEDDADTRANLRDLLELDGVRVATAASVAEAFADRDWKEVAAVILDRKLPDGAAEEVLPRLKQVAPLAAVLVVTGFADLDGVIAALREGADEYLIKPVHPDRLRASLRRVIKLKLAEAELRDRARQQEIVAQLGQLALQGAPLKNLMEQVVQWVAETLQTDFAQFLELAADGRVLIPRAARGIPAEWLHEPCDCLTDNSPYARALTTGKPEIIQRSEEPLPPSAEKENRLEKLGARSGIAVVVHGEHGAIGLLAAHSRKRRNFSPADLDFVQSAANVVGAAIERKRAEEKSLRSERLAAIGQVVTGLAHESRNALQRSLACLEMLAMEIEDRPEALDLLRRTQRAQDHLHKLFEEVRNYAAPIKLDRSECRIAEVSHEAWQLLSHQIANRKCELRETLRTQELLVSVDHFRLIQVFRNLLENSLAACTDPVIIELECADSTLRGALALQISLHDNGPGLSAEQKKRVFDPFYTTKTQGTGLGMAIAHRIVEAHGGTLRVGEGRHPGAEFVLTLPRSRT